MSGARWYEEPIDSTLRDGTRVVIRMVEADDKDALAEGVQRLSARSRYLRFHTGIEKLTERQLRYLTEVDQRDHVAWVALAEEDGHWTGVGVARFVRVTDEPDVAEAAITVIDDFQGRGLGTTLFGVLAMAAGRRGIRMFRSYVLGENAEMLALFDTLGATRSLIEPDVYQIDLPVPSAPGRLTDTAAGKVLRAVTGCQLPRMRTAAPPVWTRSTRQGDCEAPMLRAWLDRKLEQSTNRSPRDPRATDRERET